MLTKLCALVLLALVVSPFTAPFRTCGPAQAPSTASIDEVDPTSLLVPLITETGRLKIAKTRGSVIVTYSVPQPAVTWITQSITPAADVRDRSIRSTILRV
jgi:hypothetical protein